MKKIKLPHSNQVSYSAINNRMSSQKSLQINLHHQTKTNSNIVVLNNRLFDLGPTPLREKFIVTFNMFANWFQGSILKVQKESYSN